MTGSGAAGERAGVPLRAKVVEWVKRYGLAEVAGIGCALLAAVIARRATGSAIAAGYAGAWAETLGYAGVMAGQDFLTAARTANAAGRSLGARDSGGVVTGLLTEFGPAGVLDTFLTRPFAMAAGVRLLGPRLGLITGKLVSDVLFYFPVILTYERRRRREHRIE